MTDADYMQIALDLARTQMGRTAENPAVGCVLVKDGRVVGKGVTSDGGRPHGETNALAGAGGQAKGATAYVTLEPCAHHGKTPPCADALIKAGIARCIIACVDPDPRVHWQGAARLQEAEIDTILGLGEAEALEINSAFFQRFQASKEFPVRIIKELPGRNRIGAIKSLRKHTSLDFKAAIELMARIINGQSVTGFAKSNEAAVKLVQELTEWNYVAERV